MGRGNFVEIKMPNGSAEMATDELRKLLLTPDLRSTKVTVKIGGKKRVIEVREPTMKLRDEYLDRMDLEVIGQDEDGDDRIKVHGSVARAQVWLTLGCSYDPATGEKLFNAKDEATLLNLPATSFVSQVARAAQELMNSAETKAKN